jgi:hypothetical protein
MSKLTHTEAYFARKFDSIWVIVDQLTKSAHFIPVNTNYNVQRYAKNLHCSCAMLAQGSEDDHF